jgi:hypothetical protein
MRRLLYFFFSGTLDKIMKALPEAPPIKCAGCSISFSVAPSIKLPPIKIREYPPREHHWHSSIGNKMVPPDVKIKFSLDDNDGAPRQTIQRSYQRCATTNFSLGDPTMEFSGALLIKITTLLHAPVIMNAAVPDKIMRAHFSTLPR